MVAHRQLILKTVAFTSLALVAFAANSVLCRMALGEGAIDAAGFTVVRLLSGAIVLLAIINTTGKHGPGSKGSWSSSAMLFVYAVTFSFAYVSLDTGTGALILFGSVQLTMIILSVIKGNRLHFSEWLGVVVAFAGFVYLVLPGVSAPSLEGLILMTLAGIAWGVYTLKGRASADPLMDTGYNFTRTIPFVLILALLSIKHIHYSSAGIILAVLSGAIASGLGYTIWYHALTGLTATQAAVVQLLVPVIAAAGGVIFVSEEIGLRLIVAALMILGGIFMVVMGRYYFLQLQESNGTRN